MTLPCIVFDQTKVSCGGERVNKTICIIIAAASRSRNVNIILFSEVIQERLKYLLLSIFGVLLHTSIIKQHGRWINYVFTSLHIIKPISLVIRSVHLIISGVCLRGFELRCQDKCYYADKKVYIISFNSMHVRIEYLNPSMLAVFWE